MKNPLEKDIKNMLYVLIVISTCIRIFLASTLELSVDEVYYWTYALYPDWSHFDHPPMVGLVIQFFSLDLLFDNELALRLGPIVFSIFNTLLIFSIGKSVRNELTGLYAAFLFNASIYCSILAGSFIIPDTPQLLCWLLSLYYLIRVLPKKSIGKRESRGFLLASLFAGLAILSKYHGVFIWAGIGLYVLRNNRSWLKNPAFYLGMIISALFAVPILIWNIQNNWISFTFHGDRVANELVFRPDYLLTELIGQVAYNNPVNYVIIFTSIVAIFKNKLQIDVEHTKLLLLNGLPIWLVFTSFSLFRQTLPHWTGPAFTPLLILSAVYLSGKIEKSKLNLSKGKILFPKEIRIATFLLCALLITAWWMINFYPGTIGKKEPLSKYGDTDFTLDMYGWEKIRQEFEKVVKRDSEQNNMPQDAAIISPKYFPGTQIDYYIAKPIGKNVYLLGPLNSIHKYAWINKNQGGLAIGDDVYMISTSNWYKDPFDHYMYYFEKIVPTDTIEISRSDKLAYYAFVYQLKGYKGNFPDRMSN